MNFTIIQCTLQIIARCLLSVQAETVQRVVEHGRCDGATLNNVLRSLRRSGTIEAGYVNLPAQRQSGPLLESSQTNRLETSMLAARIRQLSNQVMVPRLFYRASRPLCGLLGRSYQRHFDLPHWVAQQRLADAFVCHCTKVSGAIDGWQLLESPFADQAALWATFDQRVICVPIQSDRRSVHSCMTSAQQTGASYEIW